LYTSKLAARGRLIHADGQYVGHGVSHEQQVDQFFFDAEQK
jgi:hypothetical protein